MARIPVQLNLFKQSIFGKKKKSIAKFCLTSIFPRWEAYQFHFVNRMIEVHTLSDTDGPEGLGAV